MTVLFQSTRLSRASTDSNGRRDSQIKISIHRALASLDLVTLYQLSLRNYFDPQGSREPRRCSGALPEDFRYFDPQGSREPRHSINGVSAQFGQFRSTGLSRASTVMKINNDVVLQDFDPQGSREPRHNASIIYPYLLNNFDPQGSREPRPISTILRNFIMGFRSTGLSRASTEPRSFEDLFEENFDPQGSREPRRKLLDDYRRLKRISIHRALASLDGPEDTNRNTV